MLNIYTLQYKSQVLSDKNCQWTVFQQQVKIASQNKHKYWSDEKLDQFKKTDEEWSKNKKFVRRAKY